MYPDAGVELLERALGYTRGALLHVRPADLHRPTPCAGWTLDRLLDHMHDALDAFTEGADGGIAVDPAPVALDTRITTLQMKACGLLGAWSTPSTPPVVVVGGLAVPTGVIVRAAALEIAAHGWDVAQATGHATPIPHDLARELHRVATVVVDDAERGDRFGEALEHRPGAAPDERLLAFLGRTVDWTVDRAVDRPADWAVDWTGLTGPPGRVSPIRRTRERPAS